MPETDEHLGVRDGRRGVPQEFIPKVSTPESKAKELMWIKMSKFIVSLTLLGYGARTGEGGSS